VPKAAAPETKLTSALPSKNPSIFIEYPTVLVCSVTSSPSVPITLYAG